MTLALLALAWLLGIAASAFTGADPAASLAAVGLLGVFLFALRPRWSTLAYIGVGASLIFAAGWRYETTARTEAPVARFNEDQEVSLRALVSREPDEQGASQRVYLTVRESRVEGQWRADSGGVLMRTPLFPEYRYGDLLELRGSLQTPPVFDDFDYRGYLFRQGIDSVIEFPRVRVIDHDRGNAVHATLNRARSSFTESISRILPDPEGALAAGILLGTRSELPRGLSEDMQATGTSHLVAVSGQNVVLVAALMMGVVTWLIGRRPAAWIALAGVFLYAALVGAEPSVVRAAIMGALYVTAIALGRRNTAFVALGIAAAAMTAHEPQVVHDVSFQLSFAATLGLVLLTSPLAGAIEKLASRAPRFAEFPVTRLLIDVETMSTAATAFTLPIIAINFERISLVAPIANLFTVPAFIAVAGTAALAAVAGLALPGDAAFMAWVAWPPAAYMIGTIELFAGLPGASTEIRGVRVEHAIAYYACLGTLTVWLWQRPRVRAERVVTVIPAARRLVPVAALGGVLCLASALLWLATAAPDSGRLTVSFLDVGQGDAILIEGPEGHRILVDGGPSGEAITNALGRRLPFHDRRLDMVVLTHPQQDHLGGLPAVLDQYSVSSVLANPLQANSSAYEAWSDGLATHAIDPVPATRGQTIDLGHGAILSVLSPSPNIVTASLNDSSLVLRVTMGDVSFLLTGDITEKSEAALMRTGTHIEATVLKVPHHGSLTSSSPEFLSRTNSSVAVISVGARNTFGHPADEILRRLEGDHVFRTDEHGDVILSTDGSHIWVETQNWP